MYSNIVVGTDGSETAAKAVETAGLARRGLDLVTATKPTGVAGGPLAGGEPLSGRGSRSSGGQEMLAEIAGIEGVEINGMPPETGNPAAAIVRGRPRGRGRPDRGRAPRA